MGKTRAEDLIEDVRGELAKYTKLIEIGAGPPGPRAGNLIREIEILLDILESMTGRHTPNGERGLKAQLEALRAAFLKETSAIQGSAE